MLHAACSIDRILMNIKKTLLSISKTYSEFLQLISAQEEVIKHQSWIHPQNSFVYDSPQIQCLRFVFFLKHTQMYPTEVFDWTILSYMNIQLYLELEFIGHGLRNRGSDRIQYITKPKGRGKIYLCHSDFVSIRHNITQYLNGYKIIQLQHLSM